MKRCKVLILEGGGIFGAIPAHFLGSRPTDNQNLEKVDVLSGCSIGGILAAAYAAGQPFGLIDTVFQQRAAECFTKRYMAKISLLACPTYRNDTIDKVLQDMIGETKLGDVKNIYPKLSVIVPALDVTNDQYIVFDNIRHKYDDIKLRDVAGYTSAAPSYFSGREYKGNCIVDGGLIEVTPLLTTTTAIKKNFGIPFCMQDVLVLGTGMDVDEEKLTLKKYNDLGLLGIATDLLVPYAVLSNKMATRYWGENMGYGWFNYFNPCTINGKLDDVKQIPKIVKESEQFIPEFQRVWNEWLSR